MTLADWRDLATVFLAVQAFLIGLLPAIVLFFALKAIAWVQRSIGTYLPLGRDYAARAAQIADRTSRKVMAPVIGASARVAQMRRLGRAFLGLSKETRS